MSILSKMTPLNYLKEKEKFFADESYNPQFIYEEEFSPKILTKYGLPQKKYVELAKEILKRTYYGRNEYDLFMLEGPQLSQEEVTQKVHAYFEMHYLEKRFQVVWSSTYVSRATIGPDTLKLRLPADFRKEGLVGMLYHEIGTHALRRMNYEQQPWFKKKKEYGFKDYLRTEEGLAAMHSLIAHSFKSAFIQAIRYVTVDYAQTHSFAALWLVIGKYIQDPERRWNITFREKRGINDTSEGGGYTKDLVYFEGIIEAYEWLSKNNFDLPKLYIGKIAADDVEQALLLNPSFQPRLPSFYTLDKEKYMTDIEEVAECNMLKGVL